jgi:hypothetical protein
MRNISPPLLQSQTFFISVCYEISGTAKELSELTLHKRGIRINLQLPLIESEDEIQPRSNDEVFQRLVALTAIWQLQQTSQRADVIDVIRTQQLDSYFSESERQLCGAFS